MTANPKPRKRNRRQKYSAAPIAVVPPEADLGPAMLALTPMQRRFVMEFSRGPTAGYGGAISLQGCGLRGNGKFAQSHRTSGFAQSESARRLARGRLQDHPRLSV